MSLMLCNIFPVTDDMVKHAQEVLASLPLDEDRRALRHILRNGPVPDTWMRRCFPGFVDALESSPSGLTDEQWEEFYGELFQNRDYYRLSVINLLWDGDYAGQKLRRAIRVQLARSRRPPALYSRWGMAPASSSPVSSKTLGIVHFEGHRFVVERVRSRKGSSACISVDGQCLVTSQLMAACTLFVTLQHRLHHISLCDAENRVRQLLGKSSNDRDASALFDTARKRTSLLRREMIDSGIPALANLGPRWKARADHYAIERD